MSCVSVCLSAHAILAVRMIITIMKDSFVLSVRFAAILKWRFLKFSYSEVRVFFTYLGSGGHFLLMTTPRAMFHTLRYMFAYV